MSYHIILSRAVSKVLHKIPSKDVMRLSSRIDELEIEPRPPGCRKVQSVQGRYRIRVGDYRILYSINDNIHQVIIHRIAHRSEAY